MAVDGLNYPRSRILMTGLTTCRRALRIVSKCRLATLTRFNRTSGGNWNPFRLLKLFAAYRALSLMRKLSYEATYKDIFVRLTSRGYPCWTT